MLLTEKDKYEVCLNCKYWVNEVGYCLDYERGTKCEIRFDKKGNRKKKICIISTEKEKINQ